MQINPNDDRIIYLVRSKKWQIMGDQGRGFVEKTTPAT